MQFDSRMSNASEFVQKLQGNTGNNFARCPYLANIEIERRKCLHGKGDDNKLMEALIQYFVGYITTPSFSINFCFRVVVNRLLISYSPFHYGLLKWSNWTKLLDLYSFSYLVFNSRLVYNDWYFCLLGLQWLILHIST